ncbi:hypothetical protein H6F67_05145 [Microcoleus sp. FACHB-1515]|uniref:hypothetical protein n=1 Tax=Cyanophyceae TaxID=3028117 RepID=UPI001682AA21|nr:hypothetical protein [Microcoleus sp. FACHB-1515]MBD2089236.1 hypothetical protein [Microcoleus sp. FACHB-1515]
MTHNSSFGNHLPSPCIVDAGILVNKCDMQRLLSDLNRVRYIYQQDDQLLSAGEGQVMDVFADPQQSTIVANQTLYLNVCSFDYLQIGNFEEKPCFDLIQDSRQLRLIPLTTPLQDSTHRISTATLEAVVAEVLSANWDMRLDDEEF